MQSLDQESLFKIEKKHIYNRRLNQKARYVRPRTQRLHNPQTEYRYWYLDLDRAGLRGLRGDKYLVPGTWYLVLEVLQYACPQC